MKKFKDGYYLRLGGNPNSRRRHELDSMIVVKDSLVNSVALPSGKWLYVSFPRSVQEYSHVWHLEFLGDL